MFLLFNHIVMAAVLGLSIGDDETTSKFS